MSGRNRTIWPPVWMTRIERDIGMSVQEYLFEAYAMTGSMAMAARLLVEDADSRVAFQTVKDWWKVMCKRDPELWTAARTARRQYVDEIKRQNHALKIERQGVLTEIGQVRSALAGRHCKVDGVPIPERRMSKAVTCSHRCYQLWILLRYHLDEEAWTKHRRQVQARVLRYPDQYPPEAPIHAKRVLNGEETKDHGRWSISPDVSAGLQETMSRRQAAKERWGTLAAELPTPRALAKLNNRRATASPSDAEG